ncbi:hypothetical protein ABT071_35800 [Streptomyces sp. NPDC002506]|uniref:hypothetical protein n=1 Tax=Streptomyces sp. NPDC002506 TaxID=3154536 RepID=UPI003318CC63
MTFYGDDEQQAATLPDDGLVRRVKALACTAPLQALDVYKHKVEWADVRGYQMAEIALHVIDQVTIAMDFDSGADPMSVVSQVAGFAAVQQPQRSADEHLAVAEWVLHKLINVGTVDRGFSWTYGRIDDDGAYGRHEFDFKLIVERATEGKIRLRTTDEAINVLVGALDTDVESAQVAAEHKLRNLIERGRLDDAKVAAEQARHRTVQYGESLRQQLDATRRDVRTVDWEHEVPSLLNAALSHIENRYEMENQILSHITEKRDEADNPRHKRRAAELVFIVRDCISRHMQLQQRLQTAGDLFRREQDRQEFSGPPQRAALDLFGQLLLPALGLTVAEALPTLMNYFRAAVAPVVPDAVWMPSIVSRLFESGQQPEAYGAEVPDPELGAPTDVLVFTEEHQRIADGLLDIRDRPELLSLLLTRARRSAGPEVARLILHRAGHAFSPPVGDAVRTGAQRVLVAVPAGEELDDEDFGGDDLLLASLPIDHAHEPGGQRNSDRPLSSSRTPEQELFA